MDDALLFLPTQNRLFLLVAPHAGHAAMLELAARLAVRGPLRVLDGGNQFNVYPVARSIRRRTPHLEAALGAIHLARAFTCYQMLALLQESTPQAVPTLVLDLLSTFYDQDVALPESRRLLRACLDELQRLSQSAPVVVSARPPAVLCPERLPLLDALRQASDERWEA